MTKASVRVLKAIFIVPDFHSCSLPHRNKEENVFYFLTSHRRNEAWFHLVRLFQSVLGP